MICKITLTQQAVDRIEKLNKKACLIEIKRGGCFGYATSFSFDIPNENISLIKNQNDIECYILGLDKLPDNITNLDFIIDYESTLMKSGFVIKSTDTPSCCCNKSFKIDRTEKINKANCY